MQPGEFSAAFLPERLSWTTSKADLLAFGEAVHASALDSRDVNENVRCAIIRLNEAIALGGIEKLLRYQ